MAKIIITGSSSGLGAALTKELSSNGHQVICYDIQDGKDVLKPEKDTFDGVDILINCAGINHIDWLANLAEDDWDRVMDVNAKGIYLMTKAALPELIKTKGTVLNIISNASHMPMTASAAYNASKGAAHTLTLQLARELGRAHGITVFGISPNKLKGTQMSSEIEARVPVVRGWTPEQAESYQLSSLLAGEETCPQTLARFIAYLLSHKRDHKFLAGCIIPYGA